MRQLRSGLALLLALSWILVVGTAGQRLFLWPLSWFRPIEQAAGRERHGLLIFPEGHRTRDGQIRPFRTAGAEAVLRAQLQAFILEMREQMVRHLVEMRARRSTH